MINYFGTLRGSIVLANNGELGSFVRSVLPDFIACGNGGAEDAPKCIPLGPAIPSYSSRKLRGHN